MVIINFQVENKVGKPRFFQETFLVTNTKFKVILKKLFLKTSNTDILFGKKMFILKFYIINKTLPTIKQVQIIN